MNSRLTKPSLRIAVSAAAAITSMLPEALDQKRLTSIIQPVYKNLPFTQLSRPPLPTDSRSFCTRGVSVYLALPRSHALRHYLSKQPLLAWSVPAEIVTTLAVPCRVVLQALRGTPSILRKRALRVDGVIRRNCIEAVRDARV